MCDCLGVQVCMWEWECGSGSVQVSDSGSVVVCLCVICCIFDADCEDKMVYGAFLTWFSV